MRWRRIPEATVRRLPVYLQALVASADRGVDMVSSESLAEAAGANSANVRKDLSYLGTQGIRGVGYPVGDLVSEISEVLGLTRELRVMIVGAGNLGRALAMYDGFGRRGFVVAAVVDADPAKVGTRAGEHVIEAFADLAGVVNREGVEFAIVATPAEAAQQVCDALVDAGITAVLNFAPAHVRVPPTVRVRRVDLSTELQILSFYAQLGDTGDLRSGVGGA